MRPRTYRETEHSCRLCGRDLELLRKPGESALSGGACWDALCGLRRGTLEECAAFLAGASWQAGEDA